MREVEAQLVRPHVGAGLADVRAEARPQGGVQQVRRRVVRRGRVARPAVHAGHDPLARLQRAGDRLDDDRLVVAQAQDVDDLRAAVAVLALDGPAVRDLAAAGRVERRLRELDDHRRAVRLHHADRRALLERLVAGEVGLRRGLGQVGRPRPQVAAERGPGAAAGARTRPLLLHERVEALGVDLEALLERELAGDLEGEAERVVQAERVLRRDRAVPSERAMTSSSSLLPCSSVRPKPSSSAFTQR